MKDSGRYINLKPRTAQPWIIFDRRGLTSAGKSAPRERRKFSNPGMGITSQPPSLAHCVPGFAENARWNGASVPILASLGDLRNSSRRGQYFSEQQLHLPKLAVSVGRPFWREDLRAQEHQQEVVRRRGGATPRRSGLQICPHCSYASLDQFLCFLHQELPNRGVGGETTTVNQSAGKFRRIAQHAWAVYRLRY